MAAERVGVERAAWEDAGSWAKPVGREGSINHKYNRNTKYKREGSIDHKYKIKIRNTRQKVA